nr:PepSY-associated TM helix domain-containing protein [uncultured Albidiferax sp.]
MNTKTNTGGFRQSMAWLHTWCGLWFTWLLYAVFLTGTLAVFAEPIGHWMTPEHALAESHAATEPGSNASRAQRLAHGMDYMARQHPRADMWEIWPNHGSDSDSGEGGGLAAYWFDAQGGYASADLDPATGAILAPAADAVQRATQGGGHFVSFHYMLHAGTFGLWLVGLVAMAMLVALVSGIVTHKRIFKDFFTFRPAKGQRSWLDAHNALAVLTLPFLFMIAYTGLAISGLSFMPAGAWSAFGSQPQPTQALYQALSDPDKPLRTGQLLAVPAMESFAQRAEAILGQKIRCVVVDNPGDASMRIGVYGQNSEAEQMGRLSASTGLVMFSAATGAVLRTRMPGGVDGGVAPLVQQVMGDLHMAHFGGLALKWLYFVSGLAGTAMVATGAILFMVKRRAKHGVEFGAATARVYRMVEGLNVAAIAGLAIACVGYLWANRLIPVALPHRDDAEIAVFFTVWLLALLHAFVRPPGRAWVEQLAALAALCLLLPLLNLLTVGDHLPAQIARGDWESAGVELTVLAFGALALWTTRRVAAPRPAKPQRAAVRRELAP